MKISIIIPCYNGEKYLADCLDSVRCQSFADFEVILIDDGSQDCTLAIAQDYAQKDHPEYYKYFQGLKQKQELVSELFWPY